MLDYIDRNLSIAKPLYDTWGNKKSAGYWGLDGNIEWRDFSAQEINVWFAESLMKTFEAFSSLARINSILLRNGEEPRGDIGYTSELKSHNSYEKYIQSIIQAIKTYPIYIEEIEIEVDMFVFVRTNTSPEKLVLSWVNNLGDMSINIDQEDKGAYLWLSMEHTLFYPYSYIGNQDNCELFELNQPLLEEALKNWEKKFNSSIDVEGLPGIYKYGFLPMD